MLCVNEQMPSKRQIFEHCRKAAKQRLVVMTNADMALWYADAWEMIDPCEAPRRPSVGHIVSCVAQHFGVSTRDILSGRRAIKVAQARQIAMRIARDRTPHSFPVIGRLFGRDHTTVLHAIKMVDLRAALDPQLAADIDAIEREVMR